MVYGWRLEPVFIALAPVTRCYSGPQDLSRFDLLDRCITEWPFLKSNGSGISYYPRNEMKQRHPKWQVKLGKACMSFHVLAFSLGLWFVGFWATLTVSLSSVLRASTKNSSTVAGSCQWHIPSIAAAWCYFDLSNVSVTVHERPPHTPWITQTVPRFGEDLKGAGGREATVASCAKLVQLLQDLRSCFAWPKLAKQVAFDGSMRIDTCNYTYIYIHFALYTFCKIRNP